MIWQPQWRGILSFKASRWHSWINWQRSRDSGIINPANLIFKQGDPARTFYLIVWGTVSLTHAGLHGNTAIQTLTTGDAVGWSWLFPPYGWHFNAMATEPTRLIEFDGERLRCLCGEQNDFGYEFMNRIAQVVINRLQHTRRKLFKLTSGL